LKKENLQMEFLLKTSEKEFRFLHLIFWNNICWARIVLPLFLLNQRIKIQDRETYYYYYYYFYFFIISSVVSYYLFGSNPPENTLIIRSLKLPSFKFRNSLISFFNHITKQSDSKLKFIFFVLNNGFSVSWNPQFLNYFSHNLNQINLPKFFFCVISLLKTNPFEYLWDLLINSIPKINLKIKTNNFPASD